MLVMTLSACEVLVRWSSHKAATGFPTPRLYLLTRHEEDAVPSEDELMTSAFDREKIMKAHQPGENDGLFGTFDEPQ